MAIHPSTFLFVLIIIAQFFLTSNQESQVLKTFDLKTLPIFFKSQLVIDKNPEKKITAHPSVPFYWYKMTQTKHFIETGICKNSIKKDIIGIKTIMTALMSISSYHIIIPFPPQNLNYAIKLQINSSASYQPFIIFLAHFLAKIPF